MNSISKKILILCAAVLPLQACVEQAEIAEAEAKPAVQEAAAATVKPAPAYSDEDITWIDVRSAQEFATGSVSKAVNIPHTELADNIVSLVSDKNAPVYLFCRSGNRAGKAKAALEAIGYTNVVNLGGVEHARDEAGELD